MIMIFNVKTLYLRNPFAMTYHNWVATDVSKEYSPQKLWRPVNPVTRRPTAEVRIVTIFDHAT